MRKIDTSKDKLVDMLSYGSIRFEANNMQD